MGEEETSNFPVARLCLPLC